MTLALLVALAGGAGAAARYGADRLLQTRLGPGLPILAINVAGSALLGGIAGTFAGAVAVVLGTGFCGGFTTFSAASIDAVRLAGEGRRRRALLIAAGGAAACVLVCALAYRLARWSVSG